EKSKKHLPLLLWLNGGLGCSSLAYGAMQELGRFRYVEFFVSLKKMSIAFDLVGFLFLLNVTLQYLKAIARSLLALPVDAIQDWIEHVAAIPVDGKEGSPDVYVTELGGTIGFSTKNPIEIMSQMVESGKHIHMRLGQKIWTNAITTGKIYQASVREKENKDVASSVMKIAVKEGRAQDLCK
ncbi:serine carboxypeptidase-like protein 40, partial [Tanacetum coccineum]